VWGEQDGQKREEAVKRNLGPVGVSLPAKRGEAWPATGVGFITTQGERGYVNVQRVPPWVIPLLVFGCCGIAGVAVDLFGIVRHLIDGPRWFNRFDLAVALAYTALIGGVDAYRRRRD